MVHLFNKILRSLIDNKICALATVVESVGSSPRESGAKMIIFSDGSIEGTIGGGSLERQVIEDALLALRRKESILKVYSLDKKSGLQACGGRIRIFIDVLEPARTLVICGAGHIGLALSLVAKLLNFRVVVLDDRRDFANRRRFPHADIVLCQTYPRAIKSLSPDKNTFIVIVTHQHSHDAACLQAALKTKAGYVGMIGSRRKIKEVFNGLLKKGFTKTQLKKVYSPIGLDIGAQTPQEIAVAIAAELIKHITSVKK
ncbi:MAG: XdhC/CoxI family protein [Candidatus Omnitrophota bacterium]